MYIEGNSANEVWEEALNRLLDQGAIQEGRDQTTKELLHVQFNISNPRNRYLSSRVISPAFAIAEVLWILSGSNKVEDIAWWNPRMKNYSDDGETLHGAYGYRLRNYKAGAHLFPIDQLTDVYHALKDNIPRRDGVLMYWNPNLDLPKSKNPRAKDIPCNITSHLLVRDGKLEWLQVMRSNDLIWGTPYNFIQFMALQEIMAGWLGVDVGSYTHISSSLHIYERHWDYADELNSADEGTYAENTDDLRVPFEESNTMIDLMIKTKKDIESADIIVLSKIIEDVENSYLNQGYKNLIYILIAEAYRKLGYSDLSIYTKALEVCTNEQLVNIFNAWLRSKQS